MPELFRLFRHGPPTLTVALLAGKLLFAPEWSLSAEVGSQRQDVRQLLRVVASRQPMAQRCQYDIDWDRTTISKYAGSDFKLPFAPSPAEEAGDFRKILNWDHRLDPAVFCSASDLSSYAAQRILEFATGAETEMVINRTLTGQPLFDMTRTRAAVVVTHLGLEGRFRLDGRLGRHPTSSASTLEIYVKTSRGWHFVRSKILGIS